ncbi:MAG: hypothetical protein QM784_29505 [Polyangiaceae bacterium]
MTAPNAFELLGLPARFALDLAELERRQRAAFAHRATEGAMESSMEGAMQGGPNVDLERINDAYRVLKDPILRAELLFELRGWSTKSAPDPALLERVFQERDAIERAKAAGDEARLFEFARVGAQTSGIDPGVPVRPSRRRGAAETAPRRTESRRRSRGRPR